MGCTNSIHPGVQKDQIEKCGQACTQASQKQGIQFAVDSNIVRRGINQSLQSVEIKKDLQKDEPCPNSQRIAQTPNEVPSNYEKNQKNPKRKKSKSIPKSVKVSRIVSKSETLLYNPELALPIIQQLSVQQLQSNLFKSLNSNLSMFPNPSISTCLNIQSLHEDLHIIAIKKQGEMATFRKPSFKHKNSYV